MKQVFLLITCLYCSVALWSADESEEEILRILQSQGKSPAITTYLRQLNATGRFHVIFIVSQPRVFAFGEVMIKELVQQFRKARFSGSISAIIRGKRYYADLAYTRSFGWNIPCVIDRDGTLLKKIGVWRVDFPIATIWDSTGTLWWWAYVDLVPTGQQLQEFLAQLSASTQPFEVVNEYQRFARTGCVAESVGFSALDIPTARIGRVVRFEDDSLHMIGPLLGSVMSGNGRWLAALDFYQQCIRIYEAETGKLKATICGDTQVFRARSWYVPDSVYWQTRKFFWADLAYPSFTDSTVWSILVATYIPYFNERAQAIRKCYLFVGYNSPFTAMTRAAEFSPSPRTICTGEYCAEGTFDVGGGFVVSKECFFLPYRRGFLTIGHDTTPARNPYENPLSDTFYTYAPLYGAFSTETGMYLDSTIGELSPGVGKTYAFGLALHEASELACDYANGLCAWVQWLVPHIYLSNGRSIPLKYYWNPTMVSSDVQRHRYSLPAECERSIILDSAGANVERVMLMADHVFVFWRVKKKGVPLAEHGQGFRVLQKYDIATATCIGEWLIPNHYDDQTLVGLTIDRHHKTAAGLYQGPMNTTLVYYDLSSVPQSRR